MFRLDDFRVLGPLSPPAAFDAHDREIPNLLYPPVPFGQAYQHLWLVSITTFIERSPVLTIPLTLAPLRVRSQIHRPLTVSVLALRLWDHCPRALTGRYLAVPRRVLVMEHQVPSSLPGDGEQSSRRLRVALGIYTRLRGWGR